MEMIQYFQVQTFVFVCTDNYFVKMLNKERKQQYIVQWMKR